MYVRNFKLNGKMIFKIVFVILTILIFIMFAIGIIHIINSNNMPYKAQNRQLLRAL